MKGKENNLEIIFDGSPFLTSTPMFNNREGQGLECSNKFNKYLFTLPKNITIQNNLNKEILEIFEIAEEFDFLENDLELEKNVNTIEIKVEKNLEIFSSQEDQKEQIIETKRRTTLPLIPIIEANRRKMMQSTIVKDSASRLKLKSKVANSSSNTVIKCFSSTNNSNMNNKNEK